MIENASPNDTRPADDPGWDNVGRPVGGLNAVYLGLFNFFDTIPGFQHLALFVRGTFFCLRLRQRIRGQVK